MSTDDRSLRLVHALDEHVDVRCGERLLFRYVHRPDAPQIEAPKPYLHPVRTLDGDLVTAYRPHDHVWHKGFQIAIAHIGSENFWGGGTFVPDRGYVDLPNLGAMTHVGFDALDADDGRIRIDERLEWVTHAGEHWFDERRTLAASLAGDCWVLSIDTAIANRSGRDFPFGSPATKGRRDAGYGGLLWRGPRSFVDGAVLGAGGLRGQDVLMGSRGPWLAFIGRQDETARANTVAFFDDPADMFAPTPWFVRSAPIVVAGPAPFFHDEHTLADGDTLRLRYHVAIADGAWSEEDVETFRAGPLAAAVEAFSTTSPEGIAR